MTTVLALEALGYGCKDNGLLFGLAAQMWSVQMPLLRFGSDAAKAKYLPRLCSGEWIGAHGMSEPDSGSDAFALRTTAVRRGDRYLLNGTKTFVSEGPVADLFLVFATIDPAKAFLGLTGFVVERSTPGLRVSREIEKMGLRTSPMAEVIFEDCEVPEENRIGREGRGGLVFNDSMEWERACILAGYLGTLERQLEACVRYSQERRQFGKPIAEFQSVANRLVDMKVRLETSRLLLYKAAWTKQRGCRGRGHGGRDRQAAPEPVAGTVRAGCRADPWGLRFHHRVRGRARPPRRCRKHLVFRHIRDPAQSHRPLPGFVRLARAGFSRLTVVEQHLRRIAATSRVATLPSGTTRMFVSFSIATT